MASKSERALNQALDAAEEVVEHRGLIVRIVRALAKLLARRR